MAVNKVALMAPLKEAELDIIPKAMVVGGGIAGMAAARSLARQGYETHMVEKSDRLGGQALQPLPHRRRRGCPAEARADGCN
jgi:heterodisulfide reductase subunit A2